MSDKLVHTSGKRKRAIARVTLKAGSGKVFINKKPLENYQPELYQMMIREPLIIAGDYASQVDIFANVRGGGVAGQAQAVRLAIGRALAEYFSRDKGLRTALEKYDRSLLVADVRRKEVYKPNRSKARAKRQKSYR